MTRHTSLLLAVVPCWALLCPVLLTSASFCGRSGVPYSFEVLPSGAPVLGCAQPSCVVAAEVSAEQSQTATPDFIEDSEFLTDSNGQADGFFRDGDRTQKRYRHESAPKLVANCSGGFNELSCPRKNQWVGGIEYIDHPRQPLILQCCSFDGLRFSQEVGSTIVGPGEAITGGEVIRNGRQISFDVVANVKKVVRPSVGAADQHSAAKISYEVTVRRMNCLPDPPEPEVEFDNDVPPEVLRVLSTASNRDLGTAEKLGKKAGALRNEKGFKTKQQAAPTEHLSEFNDNNAVEAELSRSRVQQTQPPPSPPPPQQQQQNQIPPRNSEVALGPSAPQQPPPQQLPVPPSPQQFLQQPQPQQLPAPTSPQQFLQQPQQQQPIQQQQLQQPIQQQPIQQQPIQQQQSFVQQQPIQQQQQQQLQQPIQQQPIQQPQLQLQPQTAQQQASPQPQPYLPTAPTPTVPTLAPFTFPTLFQSLFSTPTLAPFSPFAAFGSEITTTTAHPLAHLFPSLGGAAVPAPQQFGATGGGGLVPLNQPEAAPQQSLQAPINSALGAPDSQNLPQLFQLPSPSTINAQFQQGASSQSLVVPQQPGQQPQQGSYQYPSQQPGAYQYPQQQQPQLQLLQPPPLGAPTSTRPPPAMGSILEAMKSYHPITVPGLGVIGYSNGQTKKRK